MDRTNAKDIESLTKRVALAGPASVQRKQSSPWKVTLLSMKRCARESRIPAECPIKMPEKPFISLIYHDFSKRENGQKRNISLVNGLFGREWREKIAEQQEREYAEEDKNSEDMEIRDNICPTFMIWGICHRGHRCNLRHPSYRYLERPKRTAPSPEPVNEEPVKPLDPNSYAAVLAKRRPLKPEHFFVDLRNNFMTKKSLKEEWPAFGSISEQGLTTNAPKTWRPKCHCSNVPEVWESTTQKGARILDEKSKATAYQIEHDSLFAVNLPASAHTQLNEYDKNYRDKYNPTKQKEETYEENVQDNGNTGEEKEEHETELTHMEESRAPPKISRTCDICMDRPVEDALCL